MVPNTAIDVLNIGVGEGFPSGQKFYVNASGVTLPNGINGSDGNSGLTPYEPFLTIQKAINSCVSGRGDRIYIYPGSYTENLTITSKDYVSLIGVLLPGYARPDVVPTSGKALTVSASQGVVGIHVRFAGITDDCVRSDANGFLFKDCVFDGDLTAAKCGLRLKANDTLDSYTASEGLITDCLFRGCTNGLAFDTAAALVGVGETDVTVRDCKFVANTKDIVTLDTGAGLYSIQNGQIGPGNVFADKNKACYIDLTTSNGGAASDQKGTICGNWFAADAITAGNEVKMVGTGFTFAGNFSTVGVKDGSGLD